MIRCIGFLINTDASQATRKIFADKNKVAGEGCVGPLRFVIKANRYRMRLSGMKDLPRITKGRRALVDGCPQARVFFRFGPAIEITGHDHRLAALRLQKRTIGELADAGIVGMTDCLLLQCAQLFHLSPPLFCRIVFKMGGDDPHCPGGRFDAGFERNALHGFGGGIGGPCQQMAIHRTNRQA